MPPYLEWKVSGVNIFFLVEEQNDEGRVIKALQMLCEGRYSVESSQRTPLEELGCTKERKIKTH